MKPVCAPIALFVYNRPWHTQQTVEALLKNEESAESDLIIFSDGQKDETAGEAVDEVRQYLRTIVGFRSIMVVERDLNLGLDKSIISGITEVVNEYGRVIVLEDDLVTSPYFLKYMNDGLNCYAQDDRVISIHGYCYPIAGLPKAFFLKGADCWGWATWKRDWHLFESDGRKLLAQLKQRKLLYRFDFFGAYNYRGMLMKQIKGMNQSWAVRWYASALLNNKLTLYPGQTLVQNMGIDGSGTHCSDNGGVDLFVAPISGRPVHIGDLPVKEDQDALMAISRFFKHIQPNHFDRVINKVKRIVRGLVIR